MTQYDLIVVGGGFAGVGAALAVKGNLSDRDIDVAALQKILVERGAFLG